MWKILMNKQNIDKQAEQEGLALKRYRIEGLNHPRKQGFTKTKHPRMDLEALWNEQLRKHL
jgi:hypothetical protein